MSEWIKPSVIRTILAFMALVLVSLCVWFIGPYIAFGDMRPFGEVTTRLTVIVLMLVTVIVWLMDWTLIPMAIAAFALMIWYMGPLFAFGDTRPFAPVWARVFCISVLALGCAIWGGYTLMKYIQRDQKLSGKFFTPKDPEADSLVKKDVQEIAAITRNAVDQLKQMHLSLTGTTGSFWSGLRLLFEGKRYLYELPWYMIIGNPGAGKTTLLLNSGLTFPVAEQMGVASAQMTLAKNSGTKNCQWWFTNEAVLIDTAGRYTAPDDGVADKPKTDEQPENKKSVAENTAEWFGFLNVLKSVRGRAPINGALIAIDVAELLTFDHNQRLTQAAQLRARLAELRQHLGIRFPVYVMLTKTDKLRGFNEYFGSLTSEGREQVWGFSLPWGEQENQLKNQLQDEFNALHKRLANGVALRLQEEFELDRRQALYVLPQELEAIQAPITDLLDAVFSDSRFDTTQLTHMLRGVYFTSAMQTEDLKPVADQRALMPRLQGALQALGKRLQPRSASQNKTTKSYFVTDVLSRIVFVESYLVKPNLAWEARMKLLRVLGHSVVGIVFFWLTGALTLSYENNSKYLESADTKALALANKMTGDNNALAMSQIIRLLNEAKEVPMFDGLNLNEPSAAYMYGLYTGDAVKKSSQLAYQYLQDSLVLPIVLRRMETVLREALTVKDPTLSYDTLRAYLILHDPVEYKKSAQDVQAWVLKDWQESSGRDSKDSSGASKGLAQLFENSFAMVGHFEAMFSGERVIQSSTSVDEALVRQVRELLDKSSSSERLYQRVKTALSLQAPQDFTLAKALGPQSGTLFSRQSGQTLEKGVPGLFTYEGYHSVFAKRMAEILNVVQQDDAWVMGRQSQNAAQLNDAARTALLEEIRRQFLNEYAMLWTDFLADIRLVRNDGGATLAFDLNLLRQLASPDSPLIRLSRMAAKETTLSRLLQSKTDEETSIFEKAANQLDQQQNRASKGLGLRPEQRIEKQLVDDRFSSLREVVTGQSEGGIVYGGKPALESVSNVLNEYYTVLVVAETAINAGSLPPAGAEAAMKLKIEAGKLPSPLREVLLGIGDSGADKVAQGSSNILREQARVQMDRLVGMLALTVSEPCKRGIAGRYPFAQSSQEVSIDDFNGMFSAGGAFDEYFTKHLKPLVDTSVRPWRYKTPASLSALKGVDSTSSEQPAMTVATGPTLTGELLKLLAQSGPNPEVFAQSMQIRELFFKEPGAQRMSWPIEIKVQSLDTEVDELLLDLDGQPLRYAHGPVQASKFQWPGPRGGTLAEVALLNKGKPEPGSIQMRGPWALFHLADRGKLIQGANSSSVVVELMFGSKKAVLELVGASGAALAGDLLRGFKCPTRV